MSKSDFDIATLVVKTNKQTNKHTHTHTHTHTHIGKQSISTRT